MARIQIKRRYAEWKEDAVSAPLPAGVDSTDKDALAEWAIANYERLYTEACEADRESGTPAGVRIMWEDEFVADLDFPEDEYSVELED